MKLSALGIAIFFLYIIAIIAIGFFSGRKAQKSKSNFFLAGRKLPWYVIGFSLIASSISTEQFIGEVGWGYKYGMAVANWEWLVWPAQTLLLFIFLPVYLKNRIYTVPEYLRSRFSSFAGTTFSMISIVMYAIVNLPLVLYSGGFVLSKIFGLNLYLCIWILAVTAGVYTIYGGLSSVAWTDLLQGALLIAGGLLIFILGVKAVPGGLTEIIGTGQRAHLILPADHPQLPWTGMIALAFVSSGFYYTSNQYIIQRCLGAKNEWNGKIGIILAAFLAVPLALSVTWPGMIAYAINPDLEEVDAAYPFLITTLIPVGVRGIIFAMLIGAIMSTIDSLLNSTSSLFTLDIYKEFINKKASGRKLVVFSQIFGIILLLFSVLWAPMVGKFGTIFDYVQNCWALMLAPVMAVFILAILWKRATNTAAITTLFFAFPMLLVVFLREFYGIGEQINIFNLSGIIFIISLLMMFLISLFTEPADPKRLKTNIWKRGMLKPGEKGYPWWRRTGLWWMILVLCFVVIYVILW
jgi:SSS family solute:Na+ symporter